MEIEMFKIGQKVVVVKGPRKGQVNIVTGVRQSRCKCNVLDIETEEAEYLGSPGWMCEYCGSSGTDDFGKWRAQRLYAPLEENFAERALKEAIEGAKELEVLIEQYQKETA